MVWKNWLFITLFILNNLFAFTVKWTYTEVENYDRMTFGASPVAVDLGPDVNSVGGEPDECLEIVTGSDEYSSFFPELGAYAVGIWRCIDALGNLEWAVDTRTDESRSSLAALDFYNVGDGHIEIVGGTTSGWNVETMDRHGNFLWTFPSPPQTGGPYMWHSSPAIADIVSSVSGLEVVIGNNPCSSVWCLQADPSDGADDGIFYGTPIGHDCFAGYGVTGGSEGTDWDVIWKFDTDASVISTPAVGDVDGDGDMDVVVGDGYQHTYGLFVEETGGNIYCIDGPTGALRWRFSTGGTEPVVDASPALADFDGDGDLEIIVGAQDENLYLIDGDEDGDGNISSAEMTTVYMGGPVHSSCAIADVNNDGIFEIIAASNSGDVKCLSYSPPTTATTIWTTTLDGAIVSSPAIANPSDPYCWTHFCANPMRNNVYPYTSEEIYAFVCTMDGNVYRLNGISGSVEDIIHLGEHIHTSPIIADIDLDCQLELVVTVCNNPYGGSPDIIYCLGTDLYNPDCFDCRKMVSWPLCPVDTDDDVIPIVSCPEQAAVFAYAETTYWDRPDTSFTFASVNIFRRDGSEMHFAVQGVANTMNFNIVPLDTVIVNVWHNWEHLDSVIVVLDSIFTNYGCTTYTADTITFLVDIEPPVVSPASGMPSVGAAVPSGGFHIEYTAEDEPAGVMGDVSSLVVILYHSDDTYDSLFVAGSLSADLSVSESDSVVVFANVCDSIYDYGCSCGPNCTTYVYWYLVSGNGPIAEPITPPEDIVSACNPQGIWIAITDTQGVDSTTIVAIFGGDTFVCADSELSFRNDTLFFSPPLNYWTDGETITVELISADDIYGNHLQNSPVEWQFFIDYSPPSAQMTYPQDSCHTYNEQQDVSIEIFDNLAGLWVDSSTISFGDYNFTLEQVLSEISSDSLYAEVTFDPKNFGISWFPGETVDIVANLCDKPDTCGPNCAIYRWFFILPTDMPCARMPNPFTPNGDGKNDYCQFFAPGMGYDKLEISIFNIHDVLIREISVPAGENAKKLARWDGLDNNGKPVPEGLYLYVIEANGEIVCDGTITVAR